MMIIHTHPKSRLGVWSPAASTLPAAGALLFALVVSGCSADAGQEQATGKEPVASEHQALSRPPVFASWGGVGQYGGACADFANGAPATLDLGVGAGWQCFVAGVFGNTTQGGVSVFQNHFDSCYPNYGSDWVLAIDAVPGAALLGSAVCFPGTGTGANPSGLAPQTIATNVNQNTVCGFTGIGGPGTQPFSGFAAVTNDGEITPTFTGSSTWTWYETNSPYGQQTSATCAVSSTGLSWGGSNWGESQSYDFQVPAGAACFLSDASGTFNDNNFGDGVGLTPVNATTWTFTASAGKTGAFYCID